MLRELLHPLFSCVCVLRESLPFRLIFLRFPQPPLQSPSLQDARQLSRQLLRQVPPLSFCGPISLRRAFWPQQEHPRQLFWHGRVFSVQELQRERALQREQELQRERALQREKELQQERALQQKQEHPRQLFWHGRVFSVQELQREQALRRERALQREQELQREQALRRERALRQEQELQREQALRQEQALQRERELQREQALQREQTLQQGWEQRLLQVQLQSHR